MPVDTPHPAYTAMLPTWRRIRDMIAGQDAVEKNAKDYVPKLDGETDELFRARVRRACFFAATGRTADAFLGMLMRKPAVVEADAKMDATLEDADLQCHKFPTYAQNVVRELTVVCRGGTLIDWDDAEARPYFTFYAAEDIINWDLARVDKAWKLRLVVLREEITEANPADPFSPLPVCQYRVLQVTDLGVEVRVMRQTQGQWVVFSSAILQRKGTNLEEIPFVLHNVGAEGWKVAQPLLTDVASINGKHFAQSVDLENGRHIAGIPTPWAVGFAEDAKTVLPLGASKAWVSDKEYAKCGFLEFQGAGLGTLENGLKEKEGMMAALGARAMEPPKGDAEAYETVQLRASAETISLTTMADSASESLTWVVKWAAWWMGTEARVADAKATVAVNKDFFSASIQPDKLTALLAAFTAGAISWETYFYQLQQGEIYPDGRKPEEEKAAIKDNPPPAPVPGNGPGDGGNPGNGGE